MHDVIKLCIRAVVAVCSLLLNFVKIKAKHAYVNVLQTDKI